MDHLKDIKDNKSRLRDQHRRQRRALSADQRMEQQQRLNLELERLLGQWPGPIAAFMALADECSCQHLLELGFAQSKAIWLPRVAAPYQLTWHPVTDYTQLASGAYGISEPTIPAQPLPAALLILVPGLAFSPSGQRLGMGGGFYDNVLVNLDKTARRIGVAWSCQIEANIPLEPHDIGVDAILAGGRYIGKAPF